MKATLYQLDAPYRLVQKELMLDVDHLGPDEIVAETEFSVVSTGTEMAAWTGKPPLRPSTVYPRLVGYCNLAKVIKVGSEVSDIYPGDYILTHQSHRSAFICKQNEVLLTVGEQNEDSRKKLTATYLYHLAYSALLAGSYLPGFHVAIVGMGAIGIAAASLVNIFGLTPLIFTDQTVDNPEFKYVFKKQFPEKKAMQRICGMDGTDIVINTSNKWSDHLLSLQIARKGGEVVCVGFPGRGEAAVEFNPLDSQYFYDKQLCIRHCGYVTEADLSPLDVRFTLKRNIRYLATLIKDNLINPMQILNVETSWAELENVYQTLALQQNGVYSALLNWKK